MILECCCGMVMSVSLANPRSLCIRCGSTELQSINVALSLPRALRRGNKPRIRVAEPQVDAVEKSALISASIGTVITNVCKAF
jgi:hypothetical protein